MPASKKTISRPKAPKQGKLLLVVLAVVAMISIALTFITVSVNELTGKNIFATNSTTISDGKYEGASTEGVVAVDPGTIDLGAALGGQDDGMIVLPETGTTTNSTNVPINGGISLRINKGNCNPANYKNFQVVQNLAGYVYRYLSVGYAVFKTNTWNFPASFDTYQSASTYPTSVPRSYFSSYSMKTQNYIYLIDNAGNKSYITMVLSNPIGYSYNANFVNAYVTVNVTCQSANPSTIIPTRTPTATPTPTPTLAPTCAPGCRMP